MLELPTAADVADAARAISGVALRTPLITSPELDAITGARVFLKPETLQRTGSFKFRGAYNRLSRIPDDHKSAGVVAMSSGNHALGVATAAKLLGIRATNLMPIDSPATKRERTAAAGAEVVLFDREKDDRVAMAHAIAKERGAVVVPPYDDFFIMAGQGTVGREIVEDLGKLNLTPDAVFFPCGGGGLLAGSALAIHEQAPSTDLYSVEPEEFDDHARSFIAGERLANHKASGSLCDGLLVSTPGELTFSINKRHVAGGLVVSDDEVRRAVAFAFRELKLVVEPSGTAALAALLGKRIDVRGQTVVAVLTGGNVDPTLFANLIS
ncbi:threonine/serine dehydratase [Chelativorans sp. EGI FJ00035]|uniref:Threonine/serine dehydratase n=1 Tax=Chelativorans salis TaxID=2978478 RepID=A0ABT2LHJ0_9HYPH|nr:threonine/serine dehydratase [Chelativorans sp. EGI FJ00035]MCT7373734.1 threonine/serine dehydratase [Chelativorans sp. EGI FJ00035]